MNEPESLTISRVDSDDDLALLDILDHILNQGVVLRGSLVISLAGVDLVYVGLDAVLTSIETALRHVNASSANGK